MGRLLHVYDNVNNINFINIHLISTINNYEKRLEQFENIINYIKDLDNVILLGDFNDFDPNYYYVINNTINNNLTALDILNNHNIRYNINDVYNLVN